MRIYDAIQLCIYLFIYLVRRVRISFCSRLLKNPSNVGIPRHFAQTLKYKLSIIKNEKENMHLISAAINMSTLIATDLIETCRKFTRDYIGKRSIGKNESNDNLRTLSEN